LFVNKKLVNEEAMKKRAEPLGNANLATSSSSFCVDGGTPPNVL
jgi:hypothetical protein